MGVGELKSDAIRTFTQTELLAGNGVSAMGMRKVLCGFVAGVLNKSESDLNA